MIVYKKVTSQELEAVKDIYAEAKWLSYLTDDNQLVRAFDHSLYLLGAYHRDVLVGFVRCIGDGEYMVLVQDLIVKKAFQQQGIGSTLFQKVWDQFSHVRMFHVVTDLEDPVDNHFYQSFGMKRLSEGHMISYFR